MRVFKFYDLKEGTEIRIVCEERTGNTDNLIRVGEEEDGCSIRDVVLRVAEVFCKMVVPAIIAFVIYLFVADRLYEIRGYRGIGSEIFLPFLIWYAGYRIMESLF